MNGLSRLFRAIIVASLKPLYTVIKSLKIVETRPDLRR